MIETRLLEYFLVLSHQKNISQAAKSLYISQSTLSMNIPKWRSHLIRQNRATYSNLENHLIQITEPGNPI